MKLRGTVSITGVLAAAALTIPIQLVAQDSQGHKHKHHHYKLVDIGTFGGPNSSNAWSGYFTRTMNSRGAVLGEADTPAADPYCLVDGCFLNHAFQWRDGVITELHGLPGNANGTYADSINDRGWTSGISGNGRIDSLTGYPQMVAVLWKNGRIADLATLGGNASAAYAINEQGQVVGAALNTTPDLFSNSFPAPPSCGGVPCIEETYPALFFASATQMHAVVWEHGTIKDLGTLGGPDSAAFLINDVGQIAGESYVNSTPNSSTGVPTVDAFFIGKDGKMQDLGTIGGTLSWVSGLNNRGQVIGAMTVVGDTGFHPFLWDHGILTDLGTLGVDCGLATAINEAGDVVGHACSSGSIFSPVLWRNGALVSLGTVDGDPCGEAYSINSRGQIVGESGYCGNPGPNHAWLWQDGGPSIDLNTLIAPGAGMRLGHAVSINDRGEISGDAVFPNGDHHAFVLIPCDQDHPEIEGCDYDPVDDHGLVEKRK